ncbi:C2C2-YABBY transcription factor [Rhynchospora pubera]|uniref:C2C2-YABBY transcription factor n=1 Tax=Rhynchospora pubera TaxID=906938 RepID=A0AAV8DIR1_9POAL|nr:C2C2-YABBY transcription factor [Rhynchospora pubera]
MDNPIYTRAVCPNCKTALLTEIPFDMPKSCAVHCGCCQTIFPFNPDPDELQRITQIAADPEKKYRVPSSYDRFMREEIALINASKPDISPYEAFRMASKKWFKNDRGSPTLSSSDLSVQLLKKCRM